MAVANSLIFSLSLSAPPLQMHATSRSCVHCVLLDLISWNCYLIFTEDVGFLNEIEEEHCRKKPK